MSKFPTVLVRAKKNILPLPQKKYITFKPAATCTLSQHKRNYQPSSKSVHRDMKWVSTDIAAWSNSSYLIHFECFCLGSSLLSTTLPASAVCTVRSHTFIDTPSPITTQKATPCPCSPLPHHYHWHPPPPPSVRSRC